MPTNNLENINPIIANSLSPFLKTHLVDAEVSTPQKGSKGRVVALDVAPPFEPIPQLVEECLSKVQLEWMGEGDYLTWYIMVNGKEKHDGVLIGDEDNEEVINGYKDWLFDEWYKEVGHDFDSKESYAKTFDEIDYPDNFSNENDVKNYLFSIAKRSKGDVEYHHLIKMMNIAMQY